MDRRPADLLLLLLTSSLQLWSCARGQSSFTIDTVGLEILPGSTVESGTPVTIRCWVSVSKNNISDLTHTFLLSRDSVPVDSSTTAGDSLVYELNPARAADSGNYECRVTVKDKNKPSFGQKLDVTGLQTPILYLNKSEPYESEEFLATCSAPGEKGSLIFRFYQRFKTGESVKIKQSAPTGNTSETTLVLRTIGGSSLYCDYEISLVSGPRPSNQSNEVPVAVRGLNISPNMTVHPSSVVFEGDVVEVGCKVESPLRNIEVFLAKDRRILKNALVSLVHRFTLKEGDSGELVCKAEWGNVQKETYHTIEVKELFSKPNLTVEPVDIYEGDRFSLTCSVSVYVPERINTDTFQFSIYKNNVKLANATTYSTVAALSKNGNYSCKVQAASPTHSFVKGSQTVVVEAKVPVSSPILSVVGGTLVFGKPFQLLCHSNRGTLPIIYTLYSANRMLETRVVSHEGDQAIFNSTPVYKTSDVKDFRCHAKNSQDKSMVTESGQLLRSTVIIEPVSKPVLSLQPRMEAVSEGQDVTLMCSVQRGTAPVFFTWYHSKTEGALDSKSSMELKASYTIKDVRAEHQGIYSCQSSNAANQTRESLPLIIGVKMAGWKKGLIAVVCIALLLALILFIAFKKRLLGFSRRKTGELSVRSTGTKVERLSLTQAEVNKAANVTPGIMGKSVWSEHVSGSESDDQHSMTSPEKAEPQYTEVQTKEPDPYRAPVKKGTDTVYSEVRNSKQGVPEQADEPELNQDNAQLDDHSAQDENAVQGEHTYENCKSVDDKTPDQEEATNDPAPET